ncbi:MAG: type III-B CRISPR-associated protein Cas10/Cmr2 [candidate division WOR-3 bacterium]
MTKGKPINCNEKLKLFLHDPIDKVFDLKGSRDRAQEYAQILGLKDTSIGFDPDDFLSVLAVSIVKNIPNCDFTEIRHPLSQGKIDVSFSPDTLNVLRQGIENTLRALKGELEKVNQDEKIRFLCFYLWRNFLSDLKENLKETRLRAFLPILPEDPRFPDYSIWDHLNVSAALFEGLKEGRLLENSLFLFTIGPVQSFISQARKTADFYMGSFLLSYLTFRGIEVVIERFGPCQIIFPDLQNHALMDLWLRSRLSTPVKDFDPSLIYLPSIPNRFLAIIPTTNIDEIKELGEEIETKIREDLKEAISLIFDELGIRSEGIDTIISQQISEVFNTFWVAIPWINYSDDKTFNTIKDYIDQNLVNEFDNLIKFVKSINPNAPSTLLLYGLIYILAEKGLGTHKNIRRFSQPQTSRRGGRRCAVCGEREVLFFSSSDPKGKGRFTRFNEYAIDLTRNTPNKYLAEDEGLCAVCFLKRTFELYLKNRFPGQFKLFSFPSTAEIAAASVKSKYVQNAPQEFLEYAKELKKVTDFQNADSPPKLENILSEKEFYLNPPSEFLFIENLRSEYILKEFGLSVSPELLNSLRGKLSNLYDKVGKPSSYYAVIYFDGDNMGSWLSGDKLPMVNCMFNSRIWNNLDSNLKKELDEMRLRKPLSPVIHNIISRALNNFTFIFVRRIVEQEHLGKLIYAGGDDVLALTPIEDLFDIMHKLRWSFSGQVRVKNQIEVDLENDTGFVDVNGEMVLTMGPEASASMGVVITHNKTPLQIVIKKVFEMEKVAKDFGRNAFSICFMRHSGEERIAKASWKFGKQDTIKVIKEVRALFNEENRYYLSHRTLSKMFESLLKLFNPESRKYEIEMDAVKVEFKRIIKRSLVLNEKLERTEVEAAEDHALNTLWELFMSVNFDLTDFVNFIYVIINANKMEG